MSSNVFKGGYFGTNQKTTDKRIIDTNELMLNLNSLGIEGWHLVSAYSNEIGHTSSSSGFGGFSTGTNATIDQNILIFERFVRF